MDHIRILRRAFNISWGYKALWVFGILLALTTGGGGGGNGGGNANFRPDDGSGFPGTGEWPPELPRDWQREFGNLPWPIVPENIVSTILTVLVAILCLALILGVIFTILRYVSNTALIRMVDGHEATGEKVTVGRGFRLGWSRGAFRTWLVDLLFGLGGFIFVMLTLLIAAAPLLLWLTQDQTAGVIGVVLAVGLFLLAIMLWIVVFSVLSILTELIYRAIILEGLGVFDGIRRGWQLFRGRLGDSIVMGLILFGIGLVGAILMIPVFFALLIGAVVIGGLPALLAGGIANIFAQGGTPAIVAAAVGVPIFLLVLIAPLLWISGLWETYKSSTWTLTFREILALNAVVPAPAPALVPAAEPPAPEAPAAPPTAEA